MKKDFPHIELAKLCGWFGITRQAYYQNGWRIESVSLNQELIIQEVIAIRKLHPKIGTRKLYNMLAPFQMEHSIKMGRDGLFDLLSANGLLIKKRRRKLQTTNSNHWLRRYPNLVKDYAPTAPNQLWVSDITYWKIATGEHLYISFITDAYSHKIVGYQVAETMETVESIKALKIALGSLRSNTSLIHHSDRGIQYCSQAYVKLLQDNSIRISMTENGDPLENAIAERVNGIIKQEYLDNYIIDNVSTARALLKEVVNLYNNQRPHMSIGNLSPNHIHNQEPVKHNKKLWKNYFTSHNCKPNTGQSTFVNLSQD